MLILLDTVAIIQVYTGQGLRTDARQAILQAEAGGLAISAVSWWELGVLATQTRRTGPKLAHPQRWLPELIARLGARSLAVTPEVALASVLDYFPGLRDPADRLLVAAARAADASLMTRDRKILALAKQGHLRTVAC